MAEEHRLERNDGKKSFQEGQKLLYDTFKHVTTMSTGSVVLLATLLKDVFGEKPVLIELIPWIFGAFTGSAAASVIVMVLFGHSVLKDSKPGDCFEVGAFASVGAAALLFFAGIALLSYFAVMNFMNGNATGG